MIGIEAELAAMKALRGLSRNDRVRVMGRFCGSCGREHETTILRASACVHDEDEGKARAVDESDHPVAIKLRVGMSIPEKARLYDALRRSLPLSRAHSEP